MELGVLVMDVVLIIEEGYGTQCQRNAVPELFRGVIRLGLTSQGILWKANQLLVQAWIGAAGESGWKVLLWSSDPMEIA